MWDSRFLSRLESGTMQMSSENGVNPPAPNPSHNSSFSLLSVLGRERLTGPNYMDWMRNLRFTLRYENKEYVLDEQIPTINDNSTQDEIEAHQKHYDDANKVSCIMASSMSPELQKTFEFTWAYEMNQQLKEMFQAKASKERLDVVKSLMACKPKPGASICAFVLEMKGYFDRLESLNMVFDAELSINIILSGLPADYNQFVLSYQMNGKETSIMELHSLLQTAEQGIKKIDVPSISAAPVLTVGHNAKKRKTSHSNWKGKAAKGKSDRGSKRKFESEIAPTGDPKEAVCFYCNTKGHWKRSCPKYLKDLKDGKVEKGGHSGMFMIELHNTTTSDSWVLDTGCGTHICTVLQGLKESRKLKHGELNLVMGNKENRARDKDWKVRAQPNRYGYVYLIKHKSDTFEVFKRYQNKVENQLGRKIKLTPPRTPHVNGVAEMRNRTLLDIVRSMMSRATLPISFWGYALETTTHILNLVPTKKVSKTPFEMWKGKCPFLGHIKIWGCEVYDRREAEDKLEARSEKCLFIGYPEESFGYLFYKPKTSGRVSKPPQFYYGFHIEEDKISDSTLIWNLVDTTLGLKTVECKWIFKKKQTWMGKYTRIKLGSIMYVMTCTRPDVSFALSMVHKLYVWEEELRVTGYCDASWQTDKDDSHSQSDWIFLMNGGVVTWKSSKQDIVADSTCESKYIAACEASKEAIWIKNFIGDLGIVPSVQDPIEILCDNESAVSLTKEPKDHGKSKHIESNTFLFVSKVEDTVNVKHYDRRKFQNPLNKHSIRIER
ncbi:retrotransposon protein, putative, ty1-copia subclass [Tanacetum coccineum]